MPSMGGSSENYGGDDVTGGASVDNGGLGSIDPGYDPGTPDAYMGKKYGYMGNYLWDDTPVGKIIVGIAKFLGAGLINAMVGALGGLGAGINLGVSAISGKPTSIGSWAVNKIDKLVSEGVTYDSAKDAVRAEAKKAALSSGKTEAEAEAFATAIDSGVSKTYAKGKGQNGQEYVMLNPAIVDKSKKIVGGNPQESPMASVIGGKASDAWSKYVNENYGKVSQNAAATGGTPSVGSPMAAGATGTMATGNLPAALGGPALADPMTNLKLIAGQNPFVKFTGGPAGFSGFTGVKPSVKWGLGQWLDMMNANKKRKAELEANKPSDLGAALGLTKGLLDIGSQGYGLYDELFGTGIPKGEAGVDEALNSWLGEYDEYASGYNQGLNSYIAPLDDALKSGVGEDYWLDADIWM